MASFACISGEMRTFFWPCVGQQMRDNILIPLNLRTYVHMHGRNASAASVQNVLKGVDLIGVNVTPKAYVLPKPCPSKGNGYAYMYRLHECYRAIESSRVSVSWVFRIRSDHFIPFSMASLPDPTVYYTAQPWATGIALLASLSDCNCGWQKTNCTGRVHCNWVDDQFAILHGSAVSIYLRDMFSEFCNYRRIRVPQSYMRKLAPERRLARLLLPNVTVHDLRYISAALHPRLQRMSGKCGRPNDGRRPRNTSVMLALPPSAFSRALPAGPWDQRRFEVCAAQRNRPSAHRDRCLPYGNVWDDVRYGEDAKRRLRKST